MKVFLLIRTERDDFDVIYGVYSSLEKAEYASNSESVYGADIKEIELDAAPSSRY